MSHCSSLSDPVFFQWDDFDRASHMSRAARARVQQEFSIAAVARKHLDLFARLADDREVPGD